MKSIIKINFQNGDKYFYIEQLATNTDFQDFSCAIKEYNEYLLNDALRSQKDHIALTWLLRERGTKKIAKLAVSQSAHEKYKGLGSYMICTAASFALLCNQQLLAARFLTVDADIEHDEGVMAFYEKNGFIPNIELFNKNRKTINMRKDIYY